MIGLKSSIANCTERFKCATWFHLVGQALLLPAAILPLGGLLMMAGDLLGRAGFIYAQVLTEGGFVLFEQLPLLIAICLAYTLSTENHCLAAFSGAAAYLVLNKTGVAFFVALNGGVEVTDFNMGIMAGLIAGLMASWLHNHLQKAKLPLWLGFFSGKPIVPITAAAAAFVAGVASGALWAVLFKGFLIVAERLTTMGAGGAFLYGFLNRLLMPLGLHHALNQEIWLNYGEFTNLSGYLVKGDLNRFLAGDPTAGRYIAGFFPMMIFAVPAIALCFFLTARPRRRRLLIGIMAVAGLISLVSGVTEPLEYLLLFTSPLLYLVYTLLFGLSLLICYQLQVLFGFSFSAGLTDYLANWSLATNPQRIWQIGLVMAALTFAVFYFVITLLRLRTPGREPEPETELSDKAPEQPASPDQGDQ